MRRDVSGGKLSAEVIVIGGGLVGLASAVAIAERGVSVLILTERRAGEASGAAAGMLAPSVERATGPAHDFAIAARDRYPSYLDFLESRTGLRVALNRLGILQVAVSEAGVKGLRKNALPSTTWLDAKELHELEPSLSHALGAVLNPDDGAVDNVGLLIALETAVRLHERIETSDHAVARVDGANRTVQTASGSQYQADFVVVAAGAWAGKIDGARYSEPVKPARGQLVAYPSAPLRHVAYGPRGYVVPRGQRMIGGSTMEDVGFDASTTTEGIARVRSAAEEICPVLGAAPQVESWAGLRPVTPDLLPIIGADPEYPSLLYACGHSRNGVLLAPLTGDLIADLVTAKPLSYDLSQFRPGRF